MAKHTVEGLADLSKKLEELATSKEHAAALREAVREPMSWVVGRAEANLSKISPGKTPIHKTYLGRMVTAGFAARSLRLIVRMDKGKTMAQAIIGVRKEAFYVLQFFELGTSRIPRQPWLLPAFYQSRSEITRIFSDIMRERIEKVARKRGREQRKLAKTWRGM